MLKPKHSKKFKADIKKYVTQKVTMSLLYEVIDKLIKQIPLEESYCDHPLKGNWKGHRECHVKPDLVLIYKSNDVYLFLERVGSHSELFK